MKNVEKMKQLATGIIKGEKTLKTKYTKAGDLIKAINDQKVTKHQLLATQNLRTVGVKGLI